MLRDGVGCVFLPRVDCVTVAVVGVLFSVLSGKFFLELLRGLSVRRGAIGDMIVLIFHVNFKRLTVFQDYFLKVEPIDRCR